MFGITYNIIICGVFPIELKLKFKLLKYVADTL